MLKHHIMRYNDKDEDVIETLHETFDKGRNG